MKSNSLHSPFIRPPRPLLYIASAYAEAEAREHDQHSRLLDLSRPDGPNHFTLKDAGAICSLCGTRNPLGNLKKMSLQEVTEPSEILVCFTRGGTIAHALHYDGKTVLGPWVNFASAETLEKALRYLGATDEQIVGHRKTMQQTGQGSSHLRLLPNRKNLLRIDWSKL